VDEAGLTARTPLIMAPPGLEADPDGEAADPIVDNGSMSSSRSGSGSSRSGIVRRASSGNAAPSDKTETSAAEAPDGDAETATDATATGSDKTAPLPADAIGKPPGHVPVDNSAVKNDTKPVAPEGSTSSLTGSRPAASSPYSDTRSFSEPSGYPGPGNRQRPGAAPPVPSYSPPSSYPRPDWTNPEQRLGQAPPLRTGQAPSSNGHTSSSGTASAAAAGSTAGLAGSVSSAWQAPGSADSNRKWQGTRARKASKRQAMLTLARVEPWSVMKFSFVASLAAFVILFVAVALLYLVLSAIGVFDSLENTVSSVTSSESSSGTNISHWFSASLILGYTALLGAVNIVLITAICTVGSVIYNLIAKLFGGIEVTLRETD
jgi:hypothetical protein